MFLVRPSSKMAYRHMTSRIIGCHSSSYRPILRNNRKQSLPSWRKTGMRFQSTLNDSAVEATIPPVSSVSPDPDDAERDLVTDAATACTTNTTDTNPVPPSRCSPQEHHRLVHIRNVGVFAHVDAGKTTVTERMLALAGVVSKAGNVDDGDTVTDFLPAERERGITIQSAAISFPWVWQNSNAGHHNTSATAPRQHDHVTVSLIDTPGHVDFSVEVHRSVAVLDGAVMVVDAVAGVQAQTETVWRAMTRPTVATTATTPLSSLQLQHELHAHEPLPCIAVINKMDKEGCHFGNAIRTLKQKLHGANPIPIHVPLFRSTEASALSSSSDNTATSPLAGLVAVDDDHDDNASSGGDFVGVVDLIRMHAVVWPDHAPVADLELCAPRVIPLVQKQQSSQSRDNGGGPTTLIPVDDNCPVTKVALAARREFLEAMAECDDQMEEYYLTEEEPTVAELRAAVRRITLSQRGLPVLASAAVRGKGVEPVLDAIADFLPSPLDRRAPELTCLDRSSNHKDNDSGGSAVAVTRRPTDDSDNSDTMALGHVLHPNLLALAFKVVHMKGRGGSGDGRVVFARVYSGTLRDRDVVQVISPPAPGEAAQKPRKERIGGMLELSGGRFGNIEDGMCKSGDVCALIGLKSVVTGDTIVMMPDRKNVAPNNKKKGVVPELVCLTGVSSPKPVLQVRLETESTSQQDELTEALRLLTIEDPSLVVEETDSVTLLSGLGELHIEVTLDRLKREYGLAVLVGPPTVTYRETITDPLMTDGLLNYDKTIGTTRLQASVNLEIHPTWDASCHESSCMVLTDPVVTVDDAVKEYLNVDMEASHEDLLLRSVVYKAIVEGCEGALRRGPLEAHEMANVRCHIRAIDAEDGLAGLQNLPGAVRAASAHAISNTLSENQDCCTVLEPKMSLEVTVPNEMVGSVLSDLTGSRRGTVVDVLVGEDMAAKGLVKGDVPLAEILGYANGLRSLTGGEGAFTAEYKGHSPTMYSSIH